MERLPVTPFLDEGRDLFGYVGGIGLLIHKLAGSQIDSPSLCAVQDGDVRRFHSFLFSNLELPACLFRDVGRGKLIGIDHLPARIIGPCRTPV